MHDSHVVKGMVLKRNAEGSVQRVADAKVAVYAQGVDTTSTETKARCGWTRRATAMAGSMQLCEHCARHGL